MERVAKFEKHIVRDIDNIIDRPYAAFSSRFFSQSGDSLIVTPVINRPVYLGQRSGSSIVTEYQMAADSPVSQFQEI